MQTLNAVVPAGLDRSNRSVATWVTGPAAPMIPIVAAIVAPKSAWYQRQLTGFRRRTRPEPLPRLPGTISVRLTAIDGRPPCELGLTDDPGGRGGGWSGPPEPASAC